MIKSATIIIFIIAASMKLSQAKKFMKLNKNFHLRANNLQSYALWYFCCCFDLLFRNLRLSSQVAVTVTFFHTTYSYDDYMRKESASTACEFNNIDIIA